MSSVNLIGKRAISELNTMRKDTDILKSILPSLSEDGIAKNEISILLCKMDALVSEAESIDGGPKLRLKIKLETNETVILSNISSTCTIIQLKRLIEESVDRPIRIQHFKIVSNGFEIKNIDERTIQSYNLQNLETLIVKEGTYQQQSNSTTTSSQQSMSLKSASLQTATDITEEALPMNGLYRLPSSGLRITSPFEALALAVHCELLDDGFITQFETPSTVAGFAPSIRELPKTALVPDGWLKEGQNVVSLLYKHSRNSKKIFSLLVVRMAETDEILITLSEKGGASNSISLNMRQHVLQASPAIDFSRRTDFLIDYETFHTSISGLIRQILPPPVPVPSNLPQPNVPVYPLEGTGALRDPFIGRIPTVGGSDVFPNFGGGYPVPVGGGSLVGPDHPIFSDRGDDDDRWRQPGFGSPSLPHQPRFDPIGPVFDPRGPDFGQGGPLDPRAGRGGRGRGGRLFPGEPNNDHFKPPGW